MPALIPPLRVALAQINSRVGDLEGNAARIAEQIGAARDAGAELVLFPELAVTGYPPEDLLLKEHFLRAAGEAVADLAPEAQGIVALVGFPERGDDVYNALAVLAEGELQAVYRKSVLPNYGVFDEQRYFQIGEGGAVLQVGDARLGLTICEDIWTPGPAGLRRGAGGRGADPQRVRLAVSRAQGPRARADADPAGARQPVRDRLLQRSSAGRTSWCSTAIRCCSTTRAACWRARRSSRRRWPSGPSTCRRR